MKIAICAVAAVVVLGLAYTLVPDVARYLKMRSM